MDPLSEYFKPELVHKAQEANPFLKLNDVVYNIIENVIIYGMLTTGTRLGVSLHPTGRGTMCST